MEGAIRTQAFNTIQDPHANAHNREWIDPKSPEFKNQVIGRGGWVGTRNCELDSGAHFFAQLWDYFVVDGLCRPEPLLDDPLVFDAVNLMVDAWIVEQHHDEKSTMCMQASKQTSGSLWCTCRCVEVAKPMAKKDDERVAKKETVERFLIFTFSLIGLSSNFEMCSTGWNTSSHTTGTQDRPSAPRQLSVSLIHLHASFR